MQHTRDGDVGQMASPTTFRIETAGARGKLIVVAVSGDPIQLNAFPHVFGGRST